MASLSGLGPLVRHLGAPFFPMNDDEVQSHVTNDTRHFDMDEAFCARMRAAIELGLESAPIGVVTTPGNKKPKYVSEQSFGR